MVILPRLLTIMLFFALSIASTTVRADTFCSPASKTTTAASGTLYDSGGPGGNYSNSEDCSFLIQPIGGGNITVSFSQFDTQNPDSLKIYDGTDASAPLLATLTGSSLPADVIATSGTMFLRFTSNSGGNRAGFTASWSSPNLTAEWHFDETSWNGTANEVLDSSGNALHGVSQNTQTTSGLLCNAANFTGSNWIQVANRTLLEVGKNNADYTVSFWLNLNATQPAGWRGIVHKGTTNFQRTFAAWFPPGGNSNNTFVPATSTTASWNEFHASTTKVAVNTWTQVTLVKQGNQFLTYFNGVLNKASTLTADTVHNTGPLYIGKDPWYNGMRGLMDELLIFSSALSAAEIQSIRANHLSGENWNGTTRTCQALAPTAEWRFDETSWNGTANEVKDSSGNALHGVSQNTQPTAGLVCNAANFTGTNWIQVANNTLLEVGKNNADYTASFWVKLDTTQLSSWRGIAHKGNNNFQRTFSAWFHQSNNKFTSWLTTTAIWTEWHASTTEVAIDTWTLVTIVKQGNQLLTYFNGVLNQTSTLAGDTVSNTGPLYIGKDPWYNGMRGLLDEFMVFRLALSATEIQSIYTNHLAGNGWDGSPRSCPNPLNHLSINHSTSAVTCAAEPITLKAHLTDHMIDTGYIDTVNLSTSTTRGDWSIISGNGTLNNATANDGAASYTFSIADNGSVQLGLKNTTIETLNINASDGSLSETSGTALPSEDQNLTFNESGFRFLANSTPGAIGTQISGKDSDTAPSVQTLELQAIRTSPATGACEAALVNNNNIDMAFECLNPGTCSGNRVAINATNIGANNSGSVNTYLPVSLNFGNVSNSTSTFKLNYPDAGQIRLHARYNIPLENGNPSGNFMTGSSNNFVVKPAGLCVESTDATSICVTPYNTCSLFKKAGQTFNLRIKGVGWQTSGESNSAFCSGNATTPNFQLNNIALLSTLVAPSPGTNASLGVTGFNMASADNGLHNITSQSISEVGVFTITATPPSYLGEIIDASASANIGRFYPDRFEVSAGSITEACSTGGFSYLGQNFTGSYTLTAKNVGGVTTTNYRNDFARLNTSASPALGTLNFGAIDNSAPTLLSGRLPLMPSTSFSWNNDGSGTLTSSLSLARLGMGSSNVDGPFTAQVGVLPTDADGVTVQLSDRNLDSNNSAPNDHVLINTSMQRYGRLVIDNAFGPEVLDLKVPLRTEYWNGTAFVINGNDTACSGSLFTTPSFIFTDPVLTDSLTEASLPSKSYSPITSGSGSLTLGAPNTSGPLNISLNVPDWLKYDFNGDGSDENPIGQAFFGQYRGNDRIIYWREQFE